MKIKTEELQQAYEIFPHFDKGLILAVYKKRNQDIEKTIQDLLTSNMKPNQRQADIDFLLDLQFPFDNKFIENEYESNAGNLNATLESLMNFSLLEEERLQEDEMKKWNDKHAQDKMEAKLSNLQELFPNVDPDQIYAEFIAHNKDVRETYEKIEMTLNQQQSSSSKSSRKSQLSEGDKNVYSKDKIFGKTSKKHFSQTIIPNSSQNDEYELQNERPRRSADDYRKIANECGESRNQYYTLACEAFKRGDGKSAKDFSEKGRQMDKLMKENHRLAALVISRDNYQDEFTLDLHHLHEREALDALEKKLKTCYKIRVITGVGKHSLGGKSVLKDAVIKFAKDRSLKISEDTEGSLKIRKR